MKLADATKIVKENPDYIVLMEQNIEQGHMVEDSQTAIKGLKTQFETARQLLADNGIFAI